MRKGNGSRTPSFILFHAQHRVCGGGLRAPSPPGLPWPSYWIISGLLCSPEGLTDPMGWKPRGGTERAKGCPSPRDPVSLYMLTHHPALYRVDSERKTENQERGKQGREEGSCMGVAAEVSRLPACARHRAAGAAPWGHLAQGGGKGHYIFCLLLNVSLISVAKGHKSISQSQVQSLLQS